MTFAYEDRDLTAAEKKSIEEVIGRQGSEHCVDYETFKYALDYWKVLTSSPLPLLPSKKIVPFIVAMWNRLKNGSDVLTRMMNNFKFSIPVRSKRPQAAAAQRIFYLSQLQVLNICCMFPKHPIDHYKTVDGFRNATNWQVRSVRSFALRLRSEYFIPQLQRCQREMTTAHAAAASSGGSREPSDDGNQSNDEEAPRGVELEVLDDPDFAHGNVTGGTPLRGFDKAVADGKVNERVRKCEHPVQVTRVKRKGIFHVPHRQQCVMCQRKTSNYCLGCHMHFCNNLPRPKTVHPGRPWTPFHILRSREEVVRNGATYGRVLRVKLGRRQGRKRVEGKMRRTEVAEVVTFQHTCYLQAHHDVLHPLMDAEQLTP